MQDTKQNLEYKVLSLEKTVGALTRQINAQTATVQQIAESGQEPQPLPQTNFIRNGDFDLSRNEYLYETDFSDADGTTVDADVSEEAFGWYAAEADTAVESTGSITSGDNTLTLDTADFISGDAGEEIVVEGAGAAGADLVTTIATYTDSTHIETTLAASTTVSSVRVRWRLREIPEDSTDDDQDADQTTNNTLKTEDHSRYGDPGIITDPDYDKTNGWARLGSTNWLCAPLPKNYLKPGTIYFPTFIYKLAAQVGGEDEYQITPFVGLWDNSEGKRCFIEGQPIEVTGTVIGTPGATTSREYFIVFYTNWGEKIGSERVTVAAAPADGEFVTNSVYVYLSWSQPRGIIRTEIYRKTGSNYKLIGLPVQGNFRDTNGTGGIPQETQTTVGGYPAVDYSRAIAILKTTESNFQAARTDKWQLFQGSIAVPSDYDKSQTTGKQWLVIGLPTAPPDPNVVLIDQVSIDDKTGVFSISPLDQAAERNLSSTPTSGDQGNPGGVYIPPGYTGCPTFEMKILVADGIALRHVPAIDLVNNKNRYRIVNRRGAAVGFTAKVTPLKQVVYELTAETGAVLRCTESHPCFVNEHDVRGKPLRELNFGDTILTRNGTVSIASNLRQIDKEFAVQITLEGEEKGFWINGFGGHNMKDYYDYSYLQY